MVSLNFPQPRETATEQAKRFCREAYEHTVREAEIDDAILAAELAELTPKTP